MEPPDPSGPGVFALGAPARIEALLEGAGFGTIRIDEVPVRFAFADVEEMLAVTADTAGPIALVLRGLSGDERERVATRLRDALAPFATDGGYELPGAALVAGATSPPSA